MPASSESITLSGDLHARPAGALAVAAGRFAAAVSVSAGTKTADAKTTSTRSARSAAGLGSALRLETSRWRIGMIASRYSANPDNDVSPPAGGGVASRSRCAPAQIAFPRAITSCLLAV